VGDEGAGHFVKMVHNGIEYGDMQLICEAYHLMKDVLGMGHDEMAKAFEEWNKTELDSFLIEITANILKFQDSDGKHLLPKIRDSAGQKGTGKWTAISALEYGVPVTLIGNVRLPAEAPHLTGAPLLSFWDVGVDWPLRTGFSGNVCNPRQRSVLSAPPV